jgi:hypothetical protein
MVSVSYSKQILWIGIYIVTLLSFSPEITGKVGYNFNGPK